MTHKKSFAEHVGGFLNAPFKVGGTKSDGYDCIGILEALTTKLNLKHPVEFEGWNLENYSELYQSDSEKALDVMLRFFDSFAKKLSLDRVVAGDLIVVEQADGVIFPALYTGSGNAITSSIRHGVCVFHIDDLNKIKFAWRLECQQQAQ